MGGGARTSNSELECVGIIVDTVTLRTIGLDITPNLVCLVSVERSNTVVGELCSPEGARVARSWSTATTTEDVPWSHGSYARRLRRELSREVRVPRVWYNPKYRMLEMLTRMGVTGETYGGAEGEK